MRVFSLDELDSLACELPDEVEKYKQYGDFDSAKAAIDRWLARPVGEILKTRLRLEKDLLERLPGDFPYTVQETVEKFQEKIPDFSERDLERLDQEGLAEWIFVNGEKHYFYRVFDTCLQKDPELRSRMSEKSEEDGVETPAPRDVTKEIHFMKANGRSCWRFRLRTSIRLADDLFRPGMYLKAHLPIPAQMHQTSQVKILSHAKGKVTIDAPDSLYRTICFEDTPKENPEFFTEYEYNVKVPYRDLSWALPGNGGSAGEFRPAEKNSGLPLPEDCLGEQYPHIRFTPYLKSLAKELTNGIEGSDESEVALKKAGAFYQYITTKVSYSYMRGYFLIPDIPQYCARNLRGDCGVQALLFITLCRICGIPAKWQSGLYFGGRDEVGPHDWAMFYVEPYGWLYADPSIGGGAYRSGEKERWEFYFGNVDPFRMVANHAFQQPYANPKRFLPDDPYDNQSGEMESDERGFWGRETFTKKELVLAERLQ